MASSTEPTESKPEVPQSSKELEKEQETKLRAKYPGMKPGAAGSALLQKRLSKGQKYFDSGDYNMAKAKMGSSSKPFPTGQKLLLQEGIEVGDEIPTPDVVQHRKGSVHAQSKLATANAPS